MIIHNTVMVATQTSMWVGEISSFIESLNCTLGAHIVRSWRRPGKS